MRPGERGYALVAAVASIAVFAAMALAILSGTRTAIETGSAEVAQARAAAAADAGIAIGLSGLLAEDADMRLQPGGPPLAVAFGDARLSIRIEDERGKIPLNLLDATLAERLLDAFGLSGTRLNIARDSLLDWLDADDEARPDGAEAAAYAPLDYRPRNAAMMSVGELRRVRGFDAVLVARMAPYLTVNFGRGNFEPEHADPIAIGVMQGDRGAIDAIERQREREGQTVALSVAPARDLVAHPLMITAVAQMPDGARAVRRTVVEMTGSVIRPYVVRSYE